MSHPCFLFCTGEVKKTTFILQASDLQDSDGSTIQYVSLVAKSTNGRLIFEKEKVILLSRQSGYIFIQTDKPVYTPNQEGKKDTDYSKTCI